MTKAAEKPDKETTEALYMEAICKKEAKQKLHKRACKTKEIGNTHRKE